MIDHVIKPYKLSEETITNVINHRDLMQDLNYLIDEGFIEYEVVDGEIHLYPS